MTKSSSSKRFDLKQDVTNKIIERIESVGKFEMPFSTYAGSPCNFKSGREYRGINVILTLFAGFSSPYWGTPKQWMEAGANIKGGKCTQIVFWSTKMKKDESGNETNVVDYMFPKYHNVLRCSCFHSVLVKIRAKMLQKHKKNTSNVFFLCFLVIL